MGYTGADGRYDWDADNLDHIARHGVEWWESQEALSDPKRTPLARGRTSGEVRYAYVGMTESGRLLVVVYVHRAEQLRVVTARPPSEHEARLYRRGRGKGRR